jgi:hypothetical protein
LVENKTLRDAAALHVTCRKEYDYVRKLGFDNPVFILPNGIDVSISEAPVDKSIVEYWVID